LTIQIDLIGRLILVILLDSHTGHPQTLAYFLMLGTLIKKSSFWNRCEYAFTALSAGFSALTAIQTQDYKRIPASFAFAFACFVAVAKWQSSKIGEQEKHDKAEQEQMSRERDEEHAEQLRREMQAEDERRNRELAEIRGKHVDAVKKMMGAILEEFHRKYFRKEAQVEWYKHRVTLFHCVEIDSDTGKDKRLRIFARAGVYKDSGCSWPVDDNDPDKCRGIAALIWFHGVGRVRTAACDWPTNGDAIEKARYAESLGITVDEASALNVKSRSFTGARITARGQKWGVLLLDSLKEDHINDKQHEKSLLEQYTELISSVLDRMES
jgi:hypothetical protein